MKNKKTLSITEARKKIYEIAEEAQKSDIKYVLTENGRPKVVVMSYDTYDNLMEDLDIYSNPKTMENIRRSEEEIARGEYYTWDELKKELGFEVQQPIMVGEKPRIKYLATSKKAKKRKKKV